MKVKIYFLNEKQASLEPFLAMFPEITEKVSFNIASEAS